MTKGAGSNSPPPTEVGVSLLRIDEEVFDDCAGWAYEREFAHCVLQQ